MELEQFINDSLASIFKGIRAANASLKKENSTDSPFFEKGTGDTKPIDFDIAVTTSNESTAGGEGKIKVFSVGLGGKLGKVDTQQNVSRIKFSVNTHGVIS